MRNANHSATHLLHSALRETLGTHVEQAGSHVEPDALRFDFTHFSALTSSEISRVEARVNEMILAGVDITSSVMKLDEAKTAGATALFGEKYGDTVRVVKMGDFSMELCGGTHLSNTARAGLFKIKSESSIAAGVRRIEAVTGSGVLELLEAERAMLAETAAVLKTAPADAARRAEQVITELKTAQKEIENLSLCTAKAELDTAMKNAYDIKGVKLVIVKLSGIQLETVRKLGDDLKSRDDALCALFAVVNGDKLNFAAFSTKKAVAAGLHAGNLVKSVAALTGGNGGGRPDSASAGGRELDKLEYAVSQVQRIALEMAK